MRSRARRSRFQGSEGPSRPDPPTPARIRHTRTPMLRGRVEMLRWGPSGPPPAPLLIWLRLLASFRSPSRSVTLPLPRSLFFCSLFVFLVLFLFLPSILRTLLVPPPPPPLLLLLLLLLPPRAYMYTRGINSRSPRKNRGNVITTLSFARSCLPASAPRTWPLTYSSYSQRAALPVPGLPNPSTRHPPRSRYPSGCSRGRCSFPGNPSP